MLTALSKVSLNNKIELGNRHYDVKASRDIQVVAESKFEGSKNFFAFESHAEFMNFIRNQHESEPHKCNFYEIVESNQKSFWYLDVDAVFTKFEESMEQDLSPETLIKTVKSNVVSFLTDINLETAYEDILILESSNSLKTSFHVIIRGAWVTENSSVRKQLYHLFIQWLKENGKETGFLDSAVYGGWQNFRTIYSTKWSTFEKGRRYMKPHADNRDVADVEYFLTYLEGNERVIGNSHLPQLQIAESEYRILKHKKQSDKLHNETFNSKTIDRDLLIENIENAYQEEIVGRPHDESIEFYVKCIPNGNKNADKVMNDANDTKVRTLYEGQPWVVWWSVGAAIHRAVKESIKLNPKDDVTVSEELNATGLGIFWKWSDNSSKSDKWMVEKTWQGYQTNYRESGYNLGTLRRLAKLCNPQVFEFNYEAFEDFSPYSEVIERYISDPWVKPYPRCNQLFEKSPMGTGKSVAVSQHIITFKPNRVICLSPRQSFASNFVGNLNSNLEGHHNRDEKPFHFVNYADLMKEGDFSCWYRHPYIVIQMESLFKIGNGRFKEYDLFVCDEIESNLKTFTSSTMLTPIDKQPSLNRLELNMAMFQKLVQSSKQCIYLDAFLTRRTIDIINDIVPFSKGNAIIRINEREVESKNATIYKHSENFENAMMKKLATGEKIMVFWSSKQHGINFESTMRKKLPGIRCKFYHADADCFLDDDLTDVNDSWGNLDCVMYTSKVTVGVNFTNPVNYAFTLPYEFALVSGHETCTTSADNNDKFNFALALQIDS
ncbi:hypothetical protein BDK51DRAFT_45779 [Blyttiomyces helicus]|uniref:Replication origin-binding protein domain-containing protein n=1 Tax=Blyttiomyces helicus TaxID=388810 RepID=A0A4P9W7T2_9FUNG|nr:hypothetical protein BDK51DRAFT_45779 [Blyttiomyces helicus]|eukprot:RKO86830.1 hypothetical protein BDK51DRAFT_45779 [Blyttiomyces helicus]